MMKTVFSSLLAPVFLAGAFLLSPSVQAKVVHGVVKNAKGKVMPGVPLKIDSLQLTVKTDEVGHFNLDIPVGEYIVDVKGDYQKHFLQPIRVSKENTGLLVVTLEDEPEHKIVIRANPLQHTALDMATPTILLSGDDLVMKRASTLGEILQHEPGLSMSSFGPAVARPVVRGLSGARVQIANNQMIVQDASTSSADHDVGIEPLLAEQIEVVKGPATLLYGSGAIGGIINVIDRKINDRLEDGLSGGVELRMGDVATKEQSLIFGLDSGSNGWNLHLDGYKSQSADLAIPGSSESQRWHEQEASELGEGSDLATEHGEETGGILENSAVDSQGGSLGLTHVTSWGHVGAAVSLVDKRYGVPGHAHHEEEGTEESHEEEEGVQIDMQQTRYDLQAKVELAGENWEHWFTGYSWTDYEHVELEGDEIGTQFNNRAWELKSYLKQNSWQGWSGVWGLQLTNRDFSAQGDEAFVPPSQTLTHSIFALEEKEFGALKWELGFRWASQELKADNLPSVSDSGVSWSSGLVYTLGSHNKIAFNFARALRFASAEELFSEGPHLATQSFEIGNASLNEEVSNNVDLSYRFEGERFSGKMNLFWNQFSDFIFGQVVLADDSCVPAGVAAEELSLVCYRQQDATFNGVELAIDYQLGRVNEHDFKLNLFADNTRAELDNGDYLPRIPPMKYGLALTHEANVFSSQISWTHFDSQERTGTNELATDGFKLLDLEFAYRTDFGRNELMVFVKGKNLLDEEARDHASFIKDLSPRGGRSLVLGLRYTF